MNRLGAIMSSWKRRGGAAFMPYLTAGYPSRKAMVPLFRMLRAAGADVLELGVPFSDPVADGPVIQQSSHMALQRGMTVDKALELAGKAVQTGLAVVLMGYANPFANYGIERLAARLRRAGVAGLLVPDLPLEESAEWKRVLARQGIALPLFAAPTTPRARLARIGSASTGFIYYVSVKGVTGERARLPAGLAERLVWLGRMSSCPVCVGFGVSSPGQARKLARVAGGVIVGSALVKRVGNWEVSSVMRRKVAHWVASMARASHAG